VQFIDKIEKIDREQWDSFVTKHPDGNIFQTPVMYDIYNNSKNYEPRLSAIIEGGELVVVMLAVIQKDYTGQLGKLTARSVVFGGPLLKTDDKDILDELLKGYFATISREVIYTQVRNFNLQNNLQKSIFKNNEFEYENHLNIILDLKKGVNELWKGVKKNRKDGINKGRKQGFVFKVTEKLANVDRFYELFKELYTNIRLPFPDVSFFQAINNYLGPNLKWFILEYNGKQVIILCSFIYNKVLYFFSIGIWQNKDFLKLRPVDFFYWEVIKWSAENGIEKVDWMGAGRPDEEYGVRKFKIQYGGDLIELGRYQKIHKPMVFYLGKSGLKIWQKLKI